MSLLFKNDFLFSVLIAGIIFAISYLWSDRFFGWLFKRSLGQREYVIQKLESMFIEVNPRQITTLMILMSFGLGALIFLATWPNFVVGLIFGSIVTVAGWSIPRLVTNYLFEKRSSAFADQMTDAMTIMANGISSGLSVPQSMERIVQNMPNPISQEFNLVLSQIRLGLSVEEGLNGLGTRMPIPDVQMFVTSINILKETGGNLAETFSTISETIRERRKVQKKIEALTAQGLMQGVIISLVPFLILVVFLVVDPGYVKPMFTTTLGWIFLFTMLALQVIGGIVIRKVVSIRV